MKNVFDSSVIGQKFGRLTVLERSDDNKSKRVLLLAECECGVIKSYRIDALKTGNTKSCGCERREKTSQRRKTHGMTGSYLYKVWVSMKKRCYKETEKCFKWYGGRGIKVCDEWVHSFDNFYEWAADKYKKGL